MLTDYAKWILVLAFCVVMNCISAAYMFSTGNIFMGVFGMGVALFIAVTIVEDDEEDDDE